jgi:hypothetical protein
VAQCPQQHSGPQVVVRDVRGYVVEVNPEANHRGLVADKLRARRGAPSHLGFTDVAADVLNLEVRLSQVEHHRLETGPEDCGDDLRADEARAAGDEHSHCA